MSTEPKYTPGPLTASREDTYPFNIVISTSAGKCAFYESSYAHSSRMRSIEDFHAGVGFPHGPDRDSAIAANERQFADALLRAAAPEMLAALEWVQRNPSAHPGNILAVVTLAIEKAKGEAA